MVLSLRLKGDLITDALSKMKISGITAPPDAEDNQLMLQRLEALLYELQERGIDLDYNFTIDPDPADFHGMQYYAFNPISSILAFRSVQDFGLQAPPTLVTQARAGNDIVSARAGRDKLRQVAYPSRQPRGSGNTQRYIRWRTFYPEPFRPPLQPPAIRMRVGETLNFERSFAERLGKNETITNIAVNASEGLTYTQVSLTDTRVNYRLTGLERSDNRIETVEFTVTTSDSQVFVETQTIELESDPFADIE